MCARSRTYSGSSMSAARLRGRGSFTSTSSASRASGPLVMSATRSDSKIASSTSCVTMNTVFRLAVHIRTSSSWMTPRVRASICAKGSSSSSTFGSVENARASPTRCRMPPDSAAGRFRSAPPSPTMSTYRWTSWSTAVRCQSRWAARTASRMLSKTVIHGISEKFWNTTMRSIPGRRTSRPSRTTPPAEGCSRPAMMLSSVLLPQPEWPTIVTNSPCSILKCTSRKTHTSPGPSVAGNSFVTWSISR